MSETFNSGGEYTTPNGSNDIQRDDCTLAHLADSVADGRLSDDLERLVEAASRHEIRLGCIACSAKPTIMKGFSNVGDALRCQAAFASEAKAVAESDLPGEASLNLLFF